MSGGMRVGPLDRLGWAGAGGARGRDRERVHLRASAVRVVPRLDDRRDPGRPGGGLVRRHQGRGRGRRRSGPRVASRGAGRHRSRSPTASRRMAGGTPAGTRSCSRPGPKARTPLLLFYKVGPSPRAWWGMLTTSDDGGRSWSRPRRLPDGHPRPDQEQAGRARRRRAAVPQQHRGPGLARPPRTHARPGPDLDQDRAAQRRRGVRRDPADGPVPSGRRAADPLPEPARQDRRVLVAGRGQDLGADAGHGPAQPQQRHRRRHPRGRPRTCWSTTTRPRAAPP